MPTPKERAARVCATTYFAHDPENCLLCARIVAEIVGATNAATIKEQERCAKVAEETACAAINPSWEAAQREIAAGIRAMT